MNPDLDRRPDRPLGGAASYWPLAVLVLLVAVAAGVGLTQMMIAPPGGELLTLALYLLGAGFGCLAGGWALLRWADRRLGLSIRTKAFAGASTGTVAGLLSILIVAQLMFVSTTHDLPLLSALLVFSGFVSGFFSLWVAGTITGRVHRVAEAIRSLAAGGYDARLGLDGDDEVARLAGDVDVLAERLRDAERRREQLDRERRDLTVAISHDLRTPLASVRAMVEALSDGVVGDDPAEVQRYFGTMRREVDRLSRMIDDLFELSRLDAGALELDRQPLSLTEVAADVVDAMQVPARNAGVSLHLNVTGTPPAAEVDGERLARAVANLMRNAIEHSRPGGSIDVTVWGEPGAVLLSVADGGEGIAREDLDRVWERFYRAERSRSRTSSAGDASDGADGAGLGLAIVRGIVEAHGGSVEVRSEPGHGAAFTLCLPATTAPAAGQRRADQAPAH